jgi:hypothetical protein
MHRVSFIITAFIFTGFLHSCKNEIVENAVSISDTLYFKTGIDNNGPLAISMIRCLGKFSDQRILLEAIIQNNSDHTIHISPERWELQCKEGNRSVPVRSGLRSASGELANGKSDTVILLYEPVHSRQLYQQTGLRGDLDLAYDLRINIAENIDQLVRLEADLASHEQSISKFGIRATTTPFVLSGLSHEELQQTFTKIKTEGASKTLLSGNEILSKGFWTKFSVFHKHDTLFMSIRIVNQTSSAVSIDMNELSLIAEGAVIQPVFSGDSKIELRNGSRGEVNISFPVKKCEHYTFDMPGIRYGEKPYRSLFDYRVNFTSLKVTIDP